MRGFILRDKTRRNLAKPLAIDAARARDVTHDEVERRELHVRREAFVPIGAGVGRLNELVDDWPAHRLIGAERVANVAMLLERFVEGDDVLHRQAGSRSDGEMCGTQRVADENAMVAGPVLIADFWK